MKQRPVAMKNIKKTKKNLKTKKRKKFIFKKKRKNKCPMADKNKGGGWGLRPQGAQKRLA